MLLSGKGLGVPSVWLVNVCFMNRMPCHLEIELLVIYLMNDRMMTELLVIS